MCGSTHLRRINIFHLVTNIAPSIDFEMFGMSHIEMVVVAQSLILQETVEDHRQKLSGAPTGMGCPDLQGPTFAQGCVKLANEPNDHNIPRGREVVATLATLHQQFDIGNALSARVLDFRPGPSLFAENGRAVRQQESLKSGPGRDYIFRLSLLGPMPVTVESTAVTSMHPHLRPSC